MSQGGGGADGPGRPRGPASLVVLPVRAEDAPWVRALLRTAWGAEVVAVHGELFRPAELPGLIAVSVAKPDGPPLGLLTYRLHPGAGPGPDCEIVTLNADPPGRGTGTALVTEVRAVAEAAGCRRIWLVTTNDNLGALAFYQKRDFRLVAVHPGAVDRARRLKPEIPAAGEHGIPLRDEIELELTLPGTEERPGR